MSTTHNNSINNIIPRNISDITGLENSAQNSKNNILNILGLNIDQGLISKIKKTLVDFLNFKKIN